MNSGCMSELVHVLVSIKACVGFVWVGVRESTLALCVYVSEGVGERQVKASMNR